LEQGTRYTRFVERHPIVVPLFCLFAFIVCAAMIFGPHYSPPDPLHPHQAAVLRIIGMILAFAYSIILVFYADARATGKWNPYIQRAIRDGENRLAEAKLDNPPHWRG
jgi:hypothetical protein